MSSLNFKKEIFYNIEIKLSYDKIFGYTPLENNKNKIYISV
jgi:hypothetical protein